MAEPKTPQRLFLSYGRRDASDLANRLRADLKNRGYEVWQDTHEIRAGKEWEEQIADGLRSTQVVIALLSPHDDILKRCKTEGTRLLKIRITNTSQTIGYPSFTFQIQTCYDEWNDPYPRFQNDCMELVTYLTAQELGSHP